MVVGGDQSNWAQVDSGVPQGTVLGPLLFLTYINDLPCNIKSTVRLFADDCVIYRNISNIQDTQLLQHDLETLTTWERQWQMKFNTDKCFVLRIPASRSPLTTQYTLGNSILQETKCHTYLGVDIQDNLKWNSHINRITSTANKTLGFIRRNLSSCTKDAKSSAYLSLVRPTLEYCSAVWDPHTKEHIHKIDKVQRRAARMVFNDYNWETSVSNLIKKLEWDNLSTRREANRLGILHKAIGGYLAIPVWDYLRPTRRQTRRSKANNFIEHHTRINTHKFSYIPRTIIDWNNLPPNITSISKPELFKETVTSHLREEAQKQD